MLTGSVGMRCTGWVCPSSGFISKLESSSFMPQMPLRNYTWSGCAAPQKNSLGPGGRGPSEMRRRRPSPRCRRRRRCPAASAASAATTPTGPERPAPPPPPPPPGGPDPALLARGPAVE
jgi:hypothetical protein